MKINPAQINYRSPAAILEALKGLRGTPGAVSPQQDLAIRSYIDFSNLSSDDLKREEIFLSSNQIMNERDDVNLTLNIKIVGGYVIATSVNNRNRNAKPVEEMIMRANPDLQMKKLNFRDQQSVFRAFLDAVEEVTDAWSTEYAAHRESAVRNLSNFGIGKVDELKEIPLGSKQVGELDIRSVILDPWCIKTELKIDLSRRYLGQVGPHKVLIFKCPSKFVLAG